LNQPLPELGHKSWIQSFREAVSEKGKARTTKHCAESCANDRRCISHAVHTSDLRASNPESQVRPDPEPERCIALGLARVGRWDLRCI